MSFTDAIHTPRALRIGEVVVGFHGMAVDSGRYMALSFGTDDPISLKASFQGSTADMRRFAAELIRHCDVTDAAPVPAEEDDA